MPSPPTNSLLNLLNPYGSQLPEQSRRQGIDERDNDNDPDSPSNLLLAELQASSPRPQRPPPSIREPSSNGAGPSTATAISDAMDASSDDEPPRSVVYGGSPTKPVGLALAAGLKPGPRRWADKSRSPGPFRRQPDSTSTSPSQSRPSSPPHSSSTDSPVETPTAGRFAGGYNDPPEQPLISAPRTGGRTKRGQHVYHSVTADPEPTPPRRTVTHVGKRGLSGHEKALWKWTNVDDLDHFLHEVYLYYEGKGFWCIALSEVLGLL